MTKDIYKNVQDKANEFLRDKAINDVNKRLLEKDKLPEDLSEKDYDTLVSERFSELRGMKKSYIDTIKGVSALAALSALDFLGLSDEDDEDIDV